MHRRVAITALLTAFLLLASACGSNGSTPETAPTTPPGTEAPSEVTAAAPATTAATPSTEPVPTTAAVEVQGAVEFVDDATTDWGLPSAAPDRVVGALGFDRYVWARDDDGNVIPVLVEGPRGEQLRCQDPGRDCSYEDLRALAADPEAAIPADLGMTRDEVETLVAQLDTTAASVNAHPTPDEACAAGYTAVSAQNPNMGIHFVNTSLTGDGFDPANPEMLLYASPTGIGLTRADIGACDGETWNGIDGLTVVGSAFFIDISDEHPDAFAGSLDQWHVHYNSCANGQEDSISSEELCAANEGVFFEFQPNWMIHTYVADGFDSQTGVFSMWNDSVWPLSQGDVPPAEPTDAVPLAIEDFAFANVTVSVGDEVAITNGDVIPHTVAGGSAARPNNDVASGLLGTGEAYTFTADEPGAFDIYCSLHPTMTATITVEP